MRQMRVVGLALSAVILAGGCATPNGSSGVHYAAATPTPATGARATFAMVDSAFAQSVADREGPKATIRASFANLAGSRRVQGTFRLDDDAYVLVGHIDADGTVRVIFPLNPQDDGFVRGGKTYQTQEVFGGFADVYSQRLSMGLFRPASSRDSYDRGFGYMFIVASWRPMRFDQFATDDKWDTFELANADFMTNPRDAIHEFAAIVAGESREAYTVEFARYYNTQGLYSGMLGGSAYSSFGSAICSGFSNGFTGYPFSDGGYFTNAYYGGMGYASSVWYRGQLYYSDPFTGCYRPSGFGGYGYGYRGYQIAGLPQTITPPRPRFFAPEGPRAPINPRGRTPHELPTQPTDGQTKGVADLPQVSPRYRERGLITADDPAPRVGRNEPRVGARAAIEDHQRPAIQDMMTHRVETANNAGDAGNNWSRIQRNARDNGSSFGGANGSEARPRIRTEGQSSGSPGSGDNSRTYRAPSNDSPRRDAPAPRSEPVQRSQPVQRSEPVQRSAPVSAPASPPSSGTPVTAGSSSSSSRPGTP